LLDVIEDYRREIITKGLFPFDADGRPTYNLVLVGRAKKNWKVGGPRACRFVQVGGLEERCGKSVLRVGQRRGSGRGHRGELNSGMVALIDQG
jgi:hypothetical protein